MLTSTQAIDAAGREIFQPGTVEFERIGEFAWSGANAVQYQVLQ
jgi:hypothetical protein